MGYNDNVPTFELERILNTTQVNDIEQIRYHISAFKWRGIYSSACTAFMIGGNYLLGGDFSVSKALAFGAASVLAVLGGDFVSGESLRLTDKRNAVQKSLNLRLQSSLMRSMKDPEALKNDEGMDYTVVPCGKFLEPCFPGYSPDYILIRASNESKRLLLTIDADAANYFDGFRESVFQTVPDESLSLDFNPLVECGLWDESDGEYTPREGFKLDTLGVVDSGYLQKRGEFKFISLNDLKECERKNLAEARTARYNFERVMDEPWNRFLDDE